MEAKSTSSTTARAQSAADKKKLRRSVQVLNKLVPKHGTMEKMDSLNDQLTESRDALQTTKGDADHLKKELEVIRQEIEKARDEFEQQLAEEKSQFESAQKRRRLLEKENADLKKRLRTADAENFEAFCSDTPNATPGTKPLNPTGAAAASSSMTTGGRHMRSGSLSVSAPSASAKSSNVLSQFVC